MSSSDDCTCASGETDLEKYSPGDQITCETCGGVLGYYGVPEESTGSAPMQDTHQVNTDDPFVKVQR